MPEVYYLPMSSSRLLKASDLYGLTKEQLRIARNEIYARHGRRFSSKDLQDYFNSKPWYHGKGTPESFDTSVLSNIEWSNIKFIEKYE